MSEARESSTEGSSKKLALRSLWKVGEKFPINLAPSVEGMVAGTRWKDGVLSVILIVPSFQKQGGTWAEASIVIKPASSITRKSLSNYDYPFPTDRRITQEAFKANNNLEVLQEIVNYINKSPKTAMAQAETTTQLEPTLTAWAVEEETHLTMDLQPLEGNLPNPSYSTKGESQNITKESLFSEELMNKLASELSRRISFSSSSSQKQEKYPQSSGSDREGRVKQVIPSLIKKGKRKTGHRKSSSDSSSSSSESSSSSSSTSDVGSTNSKKRKRKKGWFRCPFSSLDTRQVTQPHTTMKGRYEERKMIRKALHNLYSHFTTLKWYVDSLKMDNSTGAFKPFANDILWLSHHACYLDHLLLHDTRGPWSAWNELSVDFVARAFLELLVRASPTRSYPEILDEKVRKWMKRKRVGLSSHFGPVPTYLSDATVTDAGIQAKGSWLGNNNRKDNRPFIPPPPPQPFRNKFPPTAGGEKKTQIPLPQ